MKAGLAGLASASQSSVALGEVPPLSAFHSSGWQSQVGFLSGWEWRRKAIPCPWRENQGLPAGGNSYHQAHVTKHLTLPHFICTTQTGSTTINPF